MKSIKHHSFTLWVHSDERDEDKVPVCDFDEGEPFDNILLEMLALDEFGIGCSLTCDTWSTLENIDVEEILK